MNEGHWNYRVMLHRSLGGIRFGIHEIFYNEAGQPHSWTEDPIELNAETLEELKNDLQHMLKAFEQPVLDLDDKASPAQIAAREEYLRGFKTSST